MQAIIEYISKYIGSISEEELQAILELAHLDTAKKGEVVFKQGEVPKKLCFILKGAVRSYYIDEEGRENTVSFGFENEPISPYASFMDQTPSSFSIVAMESIEYLWTSKQEYFDFMDKFPRFQIGIARLLSENLVKGRQHLTLMRIASSKERYESLCEMQPYLLQRAPLKHIASYLGMAIETLSRIRAGRL